MNDQLTLDLFAQSYPMPENHGSPKEAGRSVAGVRRQRSLPTTAKPRRPDLPAVGEAMPEPRGRQPGLALATLADVMIAIEARDDLPPRLRRDLVSAVRKVPEMLGRAPAQLLANLPDLRRQLDRLHPVALGISPKRLANLRADLARALKTAGASSQRNRSSSPARTRVANADGRLPEGLPVAPVALLSLVQREQAAAGGRRRRDPAALHRRAGAIQPRCQSDQASHRDRGGLEQVPGDDPGLAGHAVRAATGPPAMDLPAHRVPRVISDGYRKLSHPDRRGGHPGR